MLCPRSHCCRHAENGCLQGSKQSDVPNSVSGNASSRCSQGCSSSCTAGAWFQSACEASVIAVGCLRLPCMLCPSSHCCRDVEHCCLHGSKQTDVSSSVSSNASSRCSQGCSSSCTAAAWLWSACVANTIALSWLACLNALCQTPLPLAC